MSRPRNPRHGAGGPVLVVSHEATRTGAPRVAVEVVEALKAAGYEVVVVLRAGGPLSAEFAAHADRVVREPLPRVRATLRRLRRARRAVNRLEETLARLVLVRLRPSLAYLNTVKSACYVRPALRLGIPAVLHVHELEPMASSVLGRYVVATDLERVRLAACSPAARDNLARISRSHPGGITVVPSVIDVARIESLATEEPPAQISGSGSTLVVGACGLADEGKGVDQWLEMAASVRASRPALPVRFVWIGRVRDGKPRELARRLRAADVVDFVGEVPNPYPLMARMAVFTLPSRLDTHPLVVVEAMTLARPVVAFDVGDVPRQLSGTGVVVPAGDVSAMVDAVVGLLDDPNRRSQLGDKAAALARSRYGIDHLRLAVTGLVADELARASHASGSGNERPLK